MSDKTRQMIASIVSSDQYKEMNLPEKKADTYIRHAKDQFVFSKDLFGLDKEMFSVMKNTYDMDVVSHRHDFYEVQFVYSGQVKQNINGKELVFKRGMMTLFNKKVTHDIQACTSSDRLYHVAISERVIKQLLSLLTDTSSVKDYLESNDSRDYLILDCSGSKFEDFFEAIEKAYFFRQAGYEKNIMMYLALVFNLCQQEKDHLVTLKESRIRQIKRLIDEDYKNLTITALSKALHVHTNYLSRFIKNEMGSSFSKLLKKARMDKAAYMLMMTDLSIEAISDHVGYQNVNYFYKVFKEVYQMTPASFRLQRRK